MTTRSPNASRQRPPVIVVGGNDNALSLVRGFGRRGIDAYVINQHNSDVAKSRYAQLIRLPEHESFETAAAEWLCGPQSDGFRQSVLLAASDEALSIIADHHEVLSNRFLLDLCNPVAQRQMLDKLETYLLARDAGVPTPKFWQISTQADLAELRDELVYPIIVKPVLSHIFQQKFSTKFIVADTFEQLCQAFTVAEDAHIDVLLVEKIPGPDSQLCSYYTWLNQDGDTAFDFTKRIIRRYPTNMGLATFHITDHVKDVKQHAVQLFRHVGLQGLANAEFKYDARDGVLKLIECNARFTAANGLVARAGMDLGAFVYNQLTGLPLPPMDDFRDGLTLWDPMRDFKAFTELRRRGELSLPTWLSSVTRRHCFPGFDLTDPRPGLARLMRRVRKSRD
jgi:predicted ATP-grasp superfamily ATP-dependent carboligase